MILLLVIQSCATVCESVDYSPPGSSIHGLLQARILEWVAIPFSRGSSQQRDQTQVSCIAGRFLLSEPPGKIKSKIEAFNILRIYLSKNGFQSGSAKLEVDSNNLLTVTGGEKR